MVGKPKKCRTLVSSLLLALLGNLKFIISAVSVTCLLSSGGFELLEMNCVVPALSG